MNQRFRSTLKHPLLVLVSGVLLPASAPTYAEEGVIEELVVTGIRSAIQRGLDQKRDADTIVDAISAEELGKFPDTNVAESLQRVTGVAITRSRGGEGQFVTVRGLGQEFNTLTYNGRELATENAGREFSFDVVPSELISAAQVFKTTSASQTDGSIGGLVNIQTAKPLDNPGFRAAYQVGGQFESLGDTTDFKGSAVFSNTFAEDTFGVIGSISYQGRDIRTDTAESIAIDQSTDFNGDGVNDRLNSFNANINDERRERLGATLALQWRPTDRIELVLDGLFTSFESPSTSSSFSYFPNPGNVTNAVVDENNDVVSFTSNAVPGDPFSNIFDFVARRAEADTDTYQIGLNFKFDASDRWNFEVDASYSDADGVRDNIGSNAGSGSFFVVSFPGLDFSQTATGGRVPDVTFSALPDINATNTVPIDQLTADGARLHFSRNSSNEIRDQLFTIKGDARYEISDTTGIQFGFDFITREKGNEVFDNEDSGRFCGDTNIALPTLGPDANSFVCDRSLLFSQLLPADQLANLLVPFEGSTDGFLSSTGSNVPRDFLTPNVAVVEAAFDNLGVLAGQPSFLTPTFNAPVSNTVEENVISGYFQFDFNGDFGNVPFFANAGVRIAYTDLDSVGVTSAITNIVIDTVSGNNAVTQDSTGVQTVSNDYVDILPSFNIGFDLAENQRLRFAYSRSVARPTFNDLSTVFAITQINAGQEQASSSNPLLEAVTSDNVDISYEWYGTEDGGYATGLSFSAAVFYKDISDFITNVNTPTDFVIPNSTDLAGNPLGEQTVSFLLAAPQNGDTAEVYGIELAAQKLFNNGFGIAGNITLADSTATSGGVSSELENISDFSANASLFYEAGGFQARIALNHRSDFLASTEGEGGFAEFTDDFTQVDASISYEITPLVTVFGEGINIFNEQFFNFSVNPGTLETFIDNGARWQFGVRGRF